MTEEADDLLVSVVIPAYNAEATIQTCLQSVLAQRKVRVQPVVVDDGSLDKTPELLAAYDGIVTDRIPNSGTAGARNRGLDLAEGDLVAFLDSDDAYTVDRLANVVPLFADPGLDAILTDYQLWDGERMMGRGTDEWGSRFGMLERVRVTPRMPALFATLIGRSSLFDRLGRFDGRYRIHEDTDMLYRIMASNATVDFVPDPSYLYRQGSGKSGTWRRAAPDLIRINASHAVRRGTPSALRRVAVRRAAYLGAGYVARRVTRRA